MFQVDAEAKSAFDNYVAEYGKSYGTKEEYEFRLNIFAKNLKMVSEHNTANGDSAETLGVNHMSDWSSDEYKKLLGYKSKELTHPGRPNHHRGHHGNHHRGHHGHHGHNGHHGHHDGERKLVTDLPESVDWRIQGAVTPVKN